MTAKIKDEVEFWESYRQELLKYALNRREGVFLRENQTYERFKHLPQESVDQIVCEAFQIEIRIAGLMAEKEALALENTGKNEQ